MFISFSTSIFLLNLHPNIYLEFYHTELPPQSKKKFTFQTKHGTKLKKTKNTAVSLSRKLVTWNTEMIADRTAPEFHSSRSSRNVAGAARKMCAEKHGFAPVSASPTCPDPRPPRVPSSSALVASSRKALQDFDGKSHTSSSTGRAAATASVRCDRTTSVRKHHQVRALQDDARAVQASRSLTPTRAGGRSKGTVMPARSELRHTESWSGESASSRLTDHPKATNSFPKNLAVRALQDEERAMRTCRSLTPTRTGSGASVCSGTSDRSVRGPTRISESSESRDSDSWFFQTKLNSGQVRALKDEARERRTSRSCEPRQARRSGPKEAVTSALQAEAGAQNCEFKSKGTSYSYELSLWKRRAAEAHFLRHSVGRKETETVPRADSLEKSPAVAPHKFRRMNLQDEANESRPQSLQLTSIQPGIDRARSQGRRSLLPLIDAPTSLSRSSRSALHRNRSEELPKADVKTEDTAAKSALRSRRQPANKIVGREASGYRQAAQLAKVRRRFNSADESEWICSQFSGLLRVVTVLAVLVVLLFFLRLLLG